MLRHHRLELGQTHVECNQIEVRVLSDHDREADPDEVLEPADDYLRHRRDNGSASILTRGLPDAGES